MKYFANPYPDYDQSNVVVDTGEIKSSILQYVQSILQNTNFCEGDLYVGSSGIAAMFLKLHQSQVIEGLNQTALQNAKILIDHAKSFIRSKPIDFVSFLCGNAGIFAVSAIVHDNLSDDVISQHDLKQFLTGYPVCQKPVFNQYGNDEILFGRAGFLSGIYWLNQHLPEGQKISADIITKICDVMIDCGIHYSQTHKLKIPMMWECYGEKYLGAAHGISSILHMILESPMFGGNIQKLNQKQQIVKATIDELLNMQSADGNFPCNLEEAGQSDHELVHWCHGAPGVVYLYAKAYLIFKDQKYLDSCLRCGDFVWNKGLLRKGPGICHGIAGSGYVFLLLYRLTSDPKHLYRAAKFADFLTDEHFLREARTPDRPFSLYEGVAGTVCFLVDLLQPQKASFPFMDVFDVKY